MNQHRSPEKGVVIVTGGASGIGLALVQGLLDVGWRVLALDIRADSVQSAKETLHTRHPDQLLLDTVDVTDENRVEAILTRCDNEFGPIAGLVNSAGIAAEMPCMDTDTKTFRRILDVNVIGSFIVARAAARHMMVHRAGSIVFIGSVSGLRGNYGRIAYGASKGAIVNMTQVMAVELAEHGIRVNALAPGPIDTPLTKEVHSAAARRNWGNVVAMHRYGTPEELCGPIQWLLDEQASSYVTGQIIAVDGGFTALGLPVPEKSAENPKGP